VGLAEGVGAIRFFDSECGVGGEFGDGENQAGGVARTLLVSLKVAVLVNGG
jgi:hypothetical protein